MRAVRCKLYGPPSSLVVDDVPTPRAAAGEVVIDVKAAGVNFPDVLIIQNKYQFKPGLPFTPGAEFAGIVRATGSGVTHLRVGERVVAYTGQGAFAERASARADACVPLPDEIDFDTAAAFTLTYGTSYHALADRGELKAGETLLVLGAAGGVGLAAVEIGKALGARVLAAASTDEKLQVCGAHGADAVINYATEDLRERLRTLTDGRGPDVIFDPVGGGYAEAAFRSIGWRGRYLIIGFANGEIPKLPFNLMLLKGASLIGVFWGDFVAREPQRNAAAIAQLLAWLVAGKIKPHISARYPLDQTGAALDEMAARRVTGKIVINP